MSKYIVWAIMGILNKLTNVIISDKDMHACGEAVGNVKSAMMLTDRWSMKLLHGGEALYV